MCAISRGIYAIFRKQVWTTARQFRLAAGLVVLTGLALAGMPGQADTAQTPPAAELLPPVTRVVRASHPYPSCTVASTNHRGWREVAGYVNTPQTVHLSWEVERGGEAILLTRDEWTANQPWREFRHWNGDRKERGEIDFPCAQPIAVKLRVRAPAWPRSGIAEVRLQYARYTLAALHGPGGDGERSVVLAEGYDPSNAMDWNDPDWQRALGLDRLLRQAHQEDRLNTWIVDWGWGGAPLEQQAQDFTEIAKQIRSINGKRKCTVAVGVSMGAISLQYALAAAADHHEDLGVCKYVSINGPHRGVWVNPELIKLVRRVGSQRIGAALGSDAAQEGNEKPGSSKGHQGTFDPAAEEMVMAGLRHDAFYASLHGMADGGYDPSIPRVAFTSGALETHPDDQNRAATAKGPELLKIRVRPLGLPLWVTVKSVHEQPDYGQYPGELLPDDMRPEMEDHLRMLSVFRMDYKIKWTTAPTMVPTFSALDFPPDVTATVNGLRYTRWDESRFPTIYVSKGGNRSHEELGDWINPRNGRQLAAGGESVLQEIERSLASGS